MVHTYHNPTFKRPNVAPPPRLRSPTPPRDFVEPLSPTKPTPIEPNFNYPAINNHIHFAIPPQTAQNAPIEITRARAYSMGHKSSHKRAPSIDTLAEAALATSPAYHTHSRSNSMVLGANNFVYPHAHPPQYSYGHGTNEPPHKRARSELLPSAFVQQQYASRPATSYEPNGGWMTQAQPEPHTYQHHSRVEDAALLLNFQSGGWPGNGNSNDGGANFAIPPAPGRPHANSFPSAFHMRPVEIAAPPPPLPPLPEATLLPPFNPQDAQPLPTLPSPEKTIDDPSPKVHTDLDGDVDMLDEQVSVAQFTQQPVQTQTPPDEISTSSSARSSDVVISEASSETAPPKRRGWPKGKPRGAGARKTMAEKAATKRAAARKKTPDAKTAARAARAKPEGVFREMVEPEAARRKSLSDILVSGERAREHNEAETLIRPRARSVPLKAPMTIREASPSKAVRRKPAVNSETICAGCETSRERTNNGELDEWISCNGCKKWFHVDCAGFKKAHEVRDVDKYFCTACEPDHGKTTYVRKSTRAHASVDYAELQRGVLKTSEESVEHHYIQPIKDGTFQFDPESFPRMRPEMVTKEFFERSGTFVEPICIPAEWNPRPWAMSEDSLGATGSSDQPEAHGKNYHTDEQASAAHLDPEHFEYDTVPDNGQDKLEMIMPQGLTVRHVCNLVGGEWPIDVIDVKTQNSGAKWNLSRWADYYEEVADEMKAIRNVISLEVSQTKLGRLLQRPKIVRDIDLQDDVWPQEEADKGKFPKVQFYCLMSVADSYTDFHIDFGGSSVYYHILKGKKTFFFIPPTAKHLKAYEQWNDSPQQNYTFLPSITSECYRVDLSEGDTMLIPSGWIHAVWTPEDSLVIGGNFLNRMSYKNQFRVVEIEKVNETPVKFRYPFFQKIMWYTAIKYMNDDPLPPAVSELFYEGKRYQRDVNIWADFDGDIARNNSRPGAHNARYYSQAEVEGLPELVNFIFRTVMLVMGRVEGVSADRMKRVNASIPKGYGEPLEVAKTFALWVAWKRGNEDPPQWAHPDAVLPSSKEEQPKKLSERKLKELERKAAIDAWRVVPDRQSERVMIKNATAAAASANAASSDEVKSSPTPSTQAPNHQVHQNQTPYFQNQTYASAQTTASPAAFMMQIPGQHLSTPKTSVLGPKRVACDACRKRRIRCKHKDMVFQASPNGGAQFDDSGNPIPGPSPDWHDNITVTPPKQQMHANFMNTVMDGQPNGVAMHHDTDGEAFVNGGQHMDGHGPQPGTNAYVNANIPMTMNGVPIFGDVPKRGRSKACYECRKSKRRCIHDETGNVDPIKASETPVPRGSVPAKKRQSTEESSPLLISKKPRLSDSDGGYAHSPIQPAPVMQGHGVLKPQNTAQKTPKKSTPKAQAHAQPQEQEEHLAIDPNLFSTYSDGNSYNDGQYSYPTNEQYGVPSLEQIANEVLVDMNGNEYHDQNDATQTGHGGAPYPNGLPRPGSSGGSALSGPTKEEPNAAEADVETRLVNAFANHNQPQVHPSIETNGVPAASHPPMSPDRPKSGASNLPLYQPPAPLSQSQSPEASRRPPALPNGVSQSSQSEAVAHKEATPSKRKRDSNSATPGTKSAKKAKSDGEGPRSREPSVQTAEEKQSMELARALQQEDLGLRRRSR